MLKALAMSLSKRLSTNITEIYKTGSCHSNGDQRLINAMTQPGLLSKTSSTNKGINNGTGTLAMVANMAMI